MDVDDCGAEEVLGVDAGDRGPERGLDVGEAGEVGVGAGVVGRGGGGEGLGRTLADTRSMAMLRSSDRGRSDDRLVRIR